MSGRTCLGCAVALADPFLDLGAQPLANAFVRPEDAARPEAFIVGIPTPRVIDAAP